MKHRSANLIFSVQTLLLLSVLSHGLVFAGDEEMLSPYMEFDPETGFFIPIDPATTHQRQQDASVAAVITPDAEISMYSSMAEADEIIEANETANYLFLLLSALVLLIGAVLVWFRKADAGTG
jgi:hypothetical protein